MRGTHNEHGQLRWPTTVVWNCGLAVAFLGALALFGSLAGLTTDWWPRPASGAALLVAGLGLLAHARRRPQLRIAAGATVALIAAGSAAVIALVGVDEAIAAGAAPLPNVVAFSILAISLAAGRRFYVAAYAAAVALTLLVLTGISGYLLEVKPSNSVLAGMAPVTLAGLAVASVGLLVRWPALPPASWWVSDVTGSRLARRLVPSLTLVPLTIGWLMTVLQNVTRLSDDAVIPIGVALITGALIALLAGAVTKVDLAIATSEERHRLLALEVPVGVIRRDCTGRATFANHEALRLAGLPADARADEITMEIVHPDDRPELTRLMDQILTSGGSYEHEWRMVRADGSICWVMGRGTAQTSPAGDFAGYLSTFLDVTEAKLAQQALAKEEHRSRTLAAALPVGVLRTDARGSWTYANSRFRELWHIDPETDLAGHGWQAQVHPEDRERITAEWAAVMREHGTYSSEFRIKDPSGGYRWANIRARAERDADGTLVGYLATVSDTHDRVVAEQERATASEQFRLAFENAPIGFAVLDTRGRFTRVNPALSEVTGYDEAALCAQTPMTIVHIDDLAAVQAQFELLGRETDELSLQHRIIHAAGHEVWVESHVSLIRDRDGRIDHAIVQILDITERRHYEHRLRQLAEHDPLTGLLNRRGLEERLAHQLAEVRRYDRGGALLVLDLDGFKMVNDTLGHAIGDELIVSVAAGLRERLRDTDVIARLGGDEFAVILPHETGGDVDQVAAELVQVVRERGEAFDGRHPGRVTVSIGVAEFESQLSAQEMLIRGDIAMYDAKEGGRDRYARYEQHDDGPVPRVEAQMSWLDRITRALDEDRFELHAQPITCLEGGEPFFHEVLVRMIDEQGALVPPATFLYIVERFGLAPRLDAWVIDHALDAMVEQRQRGGRLRLSVNISGASAGDEEITALIARRLKAGQLDPGDLMLELTETAAVADIPKARRFAQEMKALGVRLALDDFGVGFGSFSYVKHLPFDVFKLDGQFVRNAVNDEVDRQIIASVVNLAHGLGKQTVAEWIEDEETVQMLLREGIDFGQGYHLGKPRPLRELLAELDPVAPPAARRIRSGARRGASARVH